MEKMLVVVFDNEAKAYEGARSLNQLDTEGSITIHAEGVIKKNADGTVSVLRTDGDFPVRTIGGTAIGSLREDPLALALALSLEALQECGGISTPPESIRISGLTLPLPLRRASVP
jgi:hypothetical protein